MFPSRTFGTFIEREKLGKIARKYCTKTEFGYRCEYDMLDDSQLSELGLKRTGDMRPKSVSNMKDKNDCFQQMMKIINATPIGKIAIFHGCSMASADKILRGQMNPGNGILGVGAYFVYNSYMSFNQEHLEWNTAVSRAMTSPTGAIVYAYLDKKFLVDFGMLWNKNKELARIILQGLTCLASVEMFFNEHGAEYDDKKSLHDGYEQLGKRARNLALEHGIKAWDDGNQIVIYDDGLMRSLDYKLVETCQTMI